MQPQQQSSRIDLTEVKALIVKKLGVERSKKYFYLLQRFLSLKLSKSEFDKQCFRLLGRENLPLHNQLIRSILKNSCQAKAPPPCQPPKTTQNHSLPNYSNGVFPPSPRKIRSSGRDRKLKDRASPLGPYSKGDYLQPSLEESNGKVMAENGEFSSLDYHEKSVKDDAVLAEPLGSLRRSLVAPLGIPFCSASVGGVRRLGPAGNFINSCDLTGSENVRKRMEQIAASNGLEGVSLESANLVNHMMDVYLKRLIKSCVDLVGARSKQQASKVVNGMWPSNHMHLQSGEVCSISMRDFKVAMEMNPQQLGEDWPLLLEKICMHSYEDD